MEAMSLDNLAYSEKYGPFSPQELDSCLQWLEKQSITFELIKDDTLEKKFQKNDPAQVLALTEFRTEVYLAQIFYLHVQFSSSAQKKQFEDCFIQKSEVIPIWVHRFKKASDQPEEFNKNAQQQKQKFWATVIILLWLIYIVFNYLIN